MKSGIWDGKIRDKEKTFKSRTTFWKAHSTNFSISNAKNKVKRAIFEVRSKEPKKPFEYWNRQRRMELSLAIDQMQTMLEYNPLQLVMPRIGKKDSLTKAPWPFRMDHMFIDDKDQENDTWKFLFREMSVVYWTVDELCDIEHETKDESPDNFLIEFFV